MTGQRVRGGLWLSAGLILGLVVTGHSLEVLATWQSNLIWVLAILLPAAGLGLRSLTWLDRLAPTPPQRSGGWELVLATSLGLGALSLLTLLLGLLGWLNTPTALGMLLVSLGLGTYQRWWQNPPIRIHGGPFWPALLAGFLLSLLLVAAAYPVGTFWRSEARGYDVMAYHLQLPREYLASGSLWPLRHNVYSFLPAGVEMLYLLQMVLLRALGLEPQMAVYPAQMLHATLMMLTAAGLYTAPLNWGRWGRWAAVLLFSSLPWVIVTGSLAYNEGGMLLFGALAMILLSQRLTAGSTGELPGESPWLVGILVGLAVSAKLSSGLLIALPLGLMAARTYRPRALLFLVLAALLVYSPWALRSVKMTGNPVFPIAAKVLGQGHWSLEQVERWDRGHHQVPHEDESPLEARLNAFGAVLKDPQWSMPGGGFWLAAALLMLIGYAGGYGLWSSMALLQLALWFLLTHVQGRFLLPMLLPLTLLAGFLTTHWPSLRWGAIGAVSLQAMASLAMLQEECRRAPIPPGLDPRSLQMPQILLREPEAYEAPKPICLVGCATPFYFRDPLIYATVFDTHPLLEPLEQRPELGPAAMLAWLKAHRFERLLIDWAEIDRFRRTYGWDSRLNRELFLNLEPLGLKPAERPQSPHTAFWRLP